MALNKRGKTWWIDFTTPSGERVRRSAETTDKTQAQELFDKLRSEAWRVHKLGDRPNYLWDDALHRWLLEKGHLRSFEERKRQLSWWHQRLKGMALADITRQVIESAIQPQRAKWSPGSCTVCLSALSSVLRVATEDWEWLDRMPRFPEMPSTPSRVRWLKAAEAQRLIACLPDYLAEMARFSLATGLRQSNVLHLEWSQVDLERKVCWIYGDQAKMGKDIHVSLNETALAVLQRQRGKHPEFVFIGPMGKPFSKFPERAWTQGVEAAGIKNFRWHDLRHTWASWLVQAGVPLHVLQVMGGWTTYSIVLRYAHLEPEHHAAHAAVVDRQLSGTFLAQLET